MSRPPAAATPSAPTRLGRLTATERRVWQAFARGETVDLRTGDAALDDPAAADRWTADRAVRGEVIAALLLGGGPAEVGSVAAVRLTGALITGDLAVDHGQLSPVLALRACRFEGALVLDGASAESVDLRGSRLPLLSAFGARIQGTLDLRDTVITGRGGRAVHAENVVVEAGLLANRAVLHGTLGLIHAQIGGQLTLIDTQLLGPDAATPSLNAGGIRIGRSLLAMRLVATGEVRLPGAHIGSSLLLTGATLDGLGGPALHAPSLAVSSEASFAPNSGGPDTRRFTAAGTVRLSGARFGRGLDLSGALFSPCPGEPALLASRMTVEDNLRIGAGMRADGEIELTGVRIAGYLDLRAMACPDALLTLAAASAAGGIQEDARSWPGRLDLDGFSYGTFDRYADASARLPLLRRQVRHTERHRVGAYRAQPYAQLADHYRRLGNDGEARTVLLTRQRVLRGKLSRPRRIPGYLLDLLVGYGYRPLRAIGWALGLLAVSSAYFDRVRPQRVSSEDTSVFNPVLYAADHLIPIIRFGQSEVWQYHGVPAVVSAVLTVLGWTLGIAIAAAATRTFNRN
ncbi:oxidoreductase [Kitasatospora nipponensis]|uniref:Oxidoreductase n=1 Tax=Kitasatospora nipponensis TaxID=258049 RepID=A0ABP4GPQ0_9ACTN